MPGIIAALAGSGTPFSILTKGTTARRDLPLLTVASKAVSVSMGVSIALLDESSTLRSSPVRRRREPGSIWSEPSCEAGLPCQVLVAPILPMITDSDEQLDALLRADRRRRRHRRDRVRAAPASGRPGVVHALPRQHHPKLIDAYAKLYRNGSYVTRSYAADLARRSSVLLRKHGLDRKESMLRIPDTRTAAVPPHLALSEPSLF